MKRYWVAGLLVLCSCISLVNYVGKGWEAYQRGDLESAEKFFRTAVRKRPRDPIAHNNLGVILMDLDKSEEAVQVLKLAAVLAKQPYAAPHVNLAKAYLEQGKLDLAKQHGAKAIELEGSNVIAMLVLANIYAARAENLKEARSYAHTATEKVSDLDKATAWSTLAEIEYKLGNETAAVQAIDTALAFDTDNPFFRQQKSLYTP